MACSTVPGPVSPAALPAPGVLGTEQGRTGQWWRCELLLATDRLSEAGDLAASSAQATRRGGQPAAARALDGIRGRSLAHAGRLAEAAQVLDATSTPARQLGPRWRTPQPS